MDPYIELANAIIVQAATDYRAAHRKLKKKPGNKDSLEMISGVERFFRSSWYETLTDIDGAWLLGKLKAEVSAI